MNKIILSLLICPFLCFSQSKSVIKNSVTKEPIPYAEIYFHKTNQSQLTDSEGEIYLNKKFKEKITISCLGFKTKTLTADSSRNIIFLYPKKNQLNEVVIKTPKKVIEYGFHNISTNLFLPTAQVKKAFYPAIYIKNPAPTISSYIKEIKARIKTLDNDEKGKIRLHLYQFDSSTKTIGKELLNDNLIFTIGSKNDVKKFNVKAEHIKLPKNGVLVALQLVNGAKTVTIRCGKDKRLKVKQSYTVPGFKLKNKGININKARLLRFDKKYPLMIGISVEQF